MQARPWHSHYDPWVPTTIRYPRVAIQDFLHFAANNAPDKIATDFYGSKMTFREIRSEALRLANAFRNHGVEKGDRVALHLPNCPQYVVAYYAALCCGALVVNVNPLYTAPELKQVVELTEPRVWVTFDMILPAVQMVAEEVAIPVVVVTRLTDYVAAAPTSTRQDLGLKEGWHHFSELVDQCSNEKLPRVDIQPDDPAVIMFTGGTTGIPKGAVLTHANYSAANFMLAAWGGNISPFRMTPEQQTVVAVMPFFHAYGQICCLNWAVINCATLILVPRFEIEEFIGILGQYEEIFWLPGVPTLLNAIVNHPRVDELKLDKRIRLVNSGAAPMPSELIDRIRDLGFMYTEGWGMTETTSLGIGNPLFGRKKYGSIGVPFPDMDVRLVDLDNGAEDVQPGQPGELIVKGPLVMSGYWNNPQETAEHIRDGWLYTGDVASQDEDGYVYIVDRKKDMVIAGGFNVFPREIDEVLFQHPKIKEAVTVGIPHEYRGETIKAFVVLKEGETATEDEIMDFCRQNLAAYKAPKMVEFRSQLPKSIIGKILRKTLREEEMAKMKEGDRPSGTQ